MPITLHIPSPLRRYAGDASTVEVQAETVGGALEEACRLHPDLSIRLLDARRELFPYWILFRNGQELPRGAVSAEAVAPGDELQIVGAVVGGQNGDQGNGGPHDVQETLDVRMRGFRERVSLEDARAQALLDLTPLPPEDAPLEQAAGRVLARSVESPIDVPSFDRSAMDGYAVRASDTFGASLYDPLRLRLVGESMPGCGSAPTLQDGEARRIMTGAPLPPGADAVLMAEDAREEGPHVLVHAAIPPRKHVGQRGEDVRRGTVVLEAGRTLRPQDVGLLASVGFATAPVHRRPSVRILVSGNELLAPGAPGPDPMRAARVYDSDGPMLVALLQRDGAVLESLRRLPDDPEALRAVLSEPGADLIVAAGASSVGREDYLPPLVRELGELPVHGVALRPAAPTGIGRIGSTRVFLLPGHPVSCLCAYDLFAGPAVRLLGGRDTRLPYPVRNLELARRVTSAIGRVDYVRVCIENERVTPLATSGAAILSSTTRADGFLLIPAGSEGVPEGGRVDVHLYDLHSRA